MAQTAYLNAIEEAERELDKLKKEHADLLRKIDALQKFIQSGLALAGQGQGYTPLFGDASTASVLVPAVSGAAISRGSIADQVAEILKAAGKPLHVKEIVRQLRTVRSFNGKNPTASIVVSIKRRGAQFKKTKPNTFALAESGGS